MPFAIQPVHIIIVLLVAFLIFGANKLPEMGRSLGKGISEFRKGTKEAAEGFKAEVSNSSNVPAVPVQAISLSTAQSATSAGNFCIQCGTPNSQEAHFCASCGAKLPDKIA